MLCLWPAFPQIVARCSEPVGFQRDLILIFLRGSLRGVLERPGVRVMVAPSPIHVHPLVA